LLVVLLTARFGLLTGMASSLLVNLALNFFFVPPVYRFTVGESENLIALLVFLGVTAVTSGLLARAERGEKAARDREKEAGLMFDLTRGLITDPAARTVLPSLCQKVREAVEAESAAVFRRSGEQFQLVAADGPSPVGDLPEEERLLATTAMDAGEVALLDGRVDVSGIRLSSTSEARVVMVPVIGAGQQFGVLRIAGGRRESADGADDMRILAAFAYVAGLALNHQALLQELTASRASQEADVLKSALLSTVSHELRSPLASIKASVTSLIDGTADWDEASRREFLSAINEETDRLTAFVSNLLDLSRLEGGAVRLKRDWYDVREMLETICDPLISRAPGRSLVLDLDRAPGEAYVDYLLFGQAIQNLVDNALKFSEERCQVRVVARNLDGELEIRVEDGGPGIPEAERERVFEKFYRSQHTRGRASGTGLGLAIARGLIAAHNGTIRAEAADSGGAALVVSLPSFSYRPEQPLPRERTAT
jgi:two-component system sensor histidine kinase KdpD